jgi:hypothetical protein
MKISKISLVYNCSLTAGLGLIAAGVWQFSHGAAGIVVGALVLAFTVYGAERMNRGRAPGGG